MKRLSVVALALGVFAGPLRGADPAPAVRLRQMNDAPFSLESLRGNVVVLDFWAPWCVPCRTSFPALDALQTNHSKQGLKVLGLTLDTNDGAPPTPPAQRIAIDPRTGMIAAAPLASAAPHTAVRSAPLAGTHLASGATRVDLKGRYQMAVVAHRDAGGAITTTCEPASALPGKQDPDAAGQGEAAREK